MVSERAKWALVLIAEAGEIEGVTRLQKYAFLIAKRVRGITNKNIGFYDDWKPSDYGPFSSQLASDIQELIREHFVTQQQVKYYDYNMALLAPTPDTEGILTYMRARYPDYIKEIRKYIDIYKHKKLSELLHDVYYLYPEYARQSKIKAEVGKQIYESDSWLNPEYDSSSE